MIFLYEQVYDRGYYICMGIISKYYRTSTCEEKKKKKKLQQDGRQYLLKGDGLVVDDGESLEPRIMVL